MLTQEEMHEVAQRIMRIEAEAEAEDRALMRKLVQEYKQRLQAGMPATTMSQKNTLQDTSQTPSNGE